MNEATARRILQTAIDEERCGEMLDCLFAGGSATVDPSGALCLASGDMLAQLMRGDD